DRAEAALGEPLGTLVTDAPAEQLARTREAQLAVLLTSLVAWEAVRDHVPAPIAFAGHSLGQVTALIAAGVLDVEDGVRFAARRAELTQQAADAHPGKMAALLGATLEQADDACAAAPEACWIANDNAPGQVVIAGTPEGLEQSTARARELGIKKVMPLNVGGAFHTPLMQDAVDGLASDVLPDVDFDAPSAPVVSNHDGNAYDDNNGGWRDRLAQHVAVPVRWRPSMETLAGLGATTCLEVGHGSMLAALAKRIPPKLPVQGVATPSDLPALEGVR
ncbi:MAG TPA: ACP S-malonyltransferase, partial [Acidimicrobiia bacterium]|nr:ACP S-malonyltransferase [Acidimicrobiia bacterium]